jgi:CubicO group peptidase (beta-lactamase class C family)
MRKLLCLLLLAAPLFADDTLPANIDKAVNEILTRTGAPSASVAVVRDGKLAYANGLAKQLVIPVARLFSLMCNRENGRS